MDGTRVTHCVILAVTGFACVQHVLMDVCNDGVGIHDELGLGRERSVATKQGDIEHTLKTTRILLRSDFQPAITSLSFFE